MGDLAHELCNQMVDRGFGPWRRSPKPTCALCGKKGLNWQQVKGSKWRLHDGKLPHICEPSPAGFGDCDA